MVKKISSIAELTAAQSSALDFENANLSSYPSMEYVKGLAARIVLAKTELVSVSKSGNPTVLREATERLALLKGLFNDIVGPDIVSFMQGERL